MLVSDRSSGDLSGLRKREPTRADLARLARTSTAVASYVVDRSPRRLAPVTADQVRAAIEAHSGRPNAVARSPRRARTNTIGLVVPPIASPFSAGTRTIAEPRSAERSA